MNWLVGATLILMLSLIFDLGLLAYAMYALLAVLLVSRYLTHVWADNLVASRECNRLSADVGDTVAVVVDVETRGRLPIPWCLAEDLLPRHALTHEPPQPEGAGEANAIVDAAPGWQTPDVVSAAVQPPRLLPAGGAGARDGRLVRPASPLSGGAKPHFLLVYPQVMPLAGYDVSARRPIGEVTMTHRLYEDPTRIAGVRWYEAGDPLNRVHWKATARTGQLHSKVYEPSTIAGATLLLEFHHESHDRAHEPVRSELAVTAAASIANAVYEMGQQIGLITNGRDAADRILQEGWDYNIRTRDAARRAASMLSDSARLQPVIVETRRGKILWRHDTLHQHDGEVADYGMACSPLVVGELVMVTIGAPDATVVAYDRESGATAWTAGQGDSAGYSSPALLKVGGKIQTVVFSGTAALGLAGDSGDVLWRYPYITDFGCNIATPLAVDGGVFLSSGENHGCVLLSLTPNGNTFDVTEVWESVGPKSVLRNEWQTSIQLEGFLFGMDNIGGAGPVTHLTCIAAATGERKWQERRYGKGNLIAADGKLFISTLRGELVVARADPQKYEELGRQTILGPTRQAPALAHGLLYLRDDAEIVCLDVREAR